MTEQATAPQPDSPELTADEARELADDLGRELYLAQDALAFVEECCVIADRDQRQITTADVREWMKGARCGRQLAADAQAATDPAVNEAIRQMDADASQPHTGAVVQSYRDHGKTLWVFRCWGDDHCDGLVSLDHASQQWAEQARARHLAEDHKVISPAATERERASEAQMEREIAGRIAITDAACEDAPPVQCWHTEAGTPCDWDVCKQPERLAAGDYGTDPRGH